MNQDSKHAKISIKIKNAIIDILLSSTSHGIPNVIRTPRLSLKILWSISTVVSFGLCCYLIIQNIMSYLKYDVTTTIRVKRELSSLFPTITICNLNFFTSQYSVDTFYEYLNNKSKEIDDNFPWMNYYLSTILFSDENLQKNISIYGDSKDKLLISSYMNILKLNKSEFSYYFHPLYGNCYQYNSGRDENGNRKDIIALTHSSRIHGFRSTLNISINDRLKTFNTEFGAIVFIHNSSISPFSEQGITISAQSITNIEVSREFSKQQPKPYSNCNGNTDNPENYNSDIYKLILKKNGYYTQKMCIEQCYQKELAEKCNCTDSALESLYEKKICAYSNQCMKEIYYNFVVPSNIEKVCIPNCPLECEEVTFKKTISTQTIESTNEKFKDLASVSIYYSNIGYTEIEESPSTSIVSLISCSIAGIAGLFLGVSFLSCVELIEIIFQIIHILKDNIKI